MFDWIPDFTELWESMSIFADIMLIVIGLGLAYLLFKLISKVTLPLIIVGQFAMLTVYIGGLIVFVGLITTTIVAVYNRIFEFTDYIVSLPGVNCLYGFIACAGADGVLSFFFTELFAIFIVVLLIRLSSVFLFAFEKISDKLWKIGVLLGLV